MRILFTALVLLLPLWSISAQADDSALVREANLALSRKDFSTAFAKFSILAKQGQAAAQFNVGAFYLNGQGVQKDSKLAFEWFGKSAAQGYARARQVIEKAAARGNAYAIDELRTLNGLGKPVAEIKAVPQPPREEVPVPKPQESKPVQQKEKPPTSFAGKSSRNALLYGDPTIAAPGKRVFGISAELSKFRSSESLYYPSGSVMDYTTQNYSVMQPGLNAWAAAGDYAVLASYARRKGSVAATVSGVGALDKSFITNSFELDARWLLRQYSGDHFMPFTLAGVALNSTSGTANEVDFKDKFKRKDILLMLGAGAIFPVNESFGFRVDARVGADRQSISGNYVPNSGVTLSFDSYSYAKTSGYSRIAAAMYFNFSRQWNAQLGLTRASYAAGVVPASNDTAFGATVGYAYR